jgi:hypothetical protein
MHVDNKLKSKTIRDNVKIIFPILHPANSTPPVVLKRYYKGEHKSITRQRYRKRAALGNGAHPFKQQFSGVLI